ncbi:hypothetical protein [Roseovarius sp.]|jgi:hypothetical protein
MMRDPMDHKGLIREAYHIDGIGPPECRSIFLDWALSLPHDTDQAQAIDAMLERYGQDAPEHPMTRVLQDGLASAGPARRRGGWRARDRDPKA